MTRFPTSIAARRHARGAALIFVLVFLLVLTTLATAALSTNTAEERMTYAASDRNRAFAAAESALAQGEQWIEAQTTQPIAMSCASPCANAPLVWSSNTTSTADWFAFDWTGLSRDFALDYGSGHSPSTRAHATLTRVAESPRYVIEEIGPNLDGSLVVGQGAAPRRWYYRITARGTGAQSNTPSTAAAIVQSAYVKTF
jgi:type IV pilus assembly protein PilX